MSNVGRMDGAFFVSRTELLSWANSFFVLSLTKVEQCANGAVYCQIIDACHPGTVHMRKVNWNARDDHQCIPNFKVLQQGLDRAGVQRHIEVDKLIRGKYQDNLEMLQWIKTYFDRTWPGGDYDPAARRFAETLPEWARGADGGSLLQVPAPVRSAGGFAAGGEVGSAASPRLSSAGPGGLGGRGVPGRPRGAAAASGAGASASAAPTRAAAALALEGMKEEHEKLRDEVVDLKITVDGLETERDFYFQKLRDIEILCQALEANPDPNVTVDKFVENVQRILYAKDEEEDEAEDGPDGEEGEVT